MVYAKVSQQKKWKKWVNSFICVVVASLIMAVNIKSFVRSGELFPGGFTGLTVLIQRVCHTYFHFEISYTFVNVALNALPAYIGYKTIGKKFTFFSLLVVVLSGIFVDMLPVISITSDRLLVAVFGGMINGIAIGTALHGRASSGGTDFIAVYLSNRFNASSWNIVLGLNAIMLTVAGMLFGWDAALYSIIFQFISTQVINIVHPNDCRATLHIITSQPEILEKALLSYTHHGVTRFDGIGCYQDAPRTLLYTVVSKDEVKEVVHFIREHDRTAFINVLKSENVFGRFYRDPLE